MTGPAVAPESEASAAPVACGGAHGLYTESGYAEIRCATCGNVPISGPTAIVALAAPEWYARTCDKDSAVTYAGASAELEHCCPWCGEDVRRDDRGIFGRATNLRCPSSPDGKHGEQAGAPPVWRASDGTEWLHAHPGGEAGWTGWKPGEDGHWLLTEEEFGAAYPDCPDAQQKTSESQTSAQASADEASR